MHSSEEREVGQFQAFVLWTKVESIPSKTCISSFLSDLGCPIKQALMSLLSQSERDFSWFRYLEKRYSKEIFKTIIQLKINAIMGFTD